MISLRQNLLKIGIQAGTPVSYQGFYSRPNSLREAIRSMDAPKAFPQVSDIYLDEAWTDEVQGVGWDGQNWIFSCDAAQKKPGAKNKAIYVFKGAKPLTLDNCICMIEYKDVGHPIQSHESDDHWGQLTCYQGYVYVSHFWAEGPRKGQTNVVVFKNNNGILEYRPPWIELPEVTSSDGTNTQYPQFQAINPWDGNLYTCQAFGDAPVRELFIHDIKDGSLKGTTPLLGFPLKNVQGACFSDNGHLYIADDTRYADFESDYKWIFCYSALNGAWFRLSNIPVLAKESDQELEGICFANVSWPDGRTAQIHAILLENRDPKDGYLTALDNIFFKSFSADRPELV